MKKRIIIASIVGVLVCALSMGIFCIFNTSKFSLRSQFFKDADRECVDQITKNANLSKEYENFNCTLREYIYDGFTVYAHFTVKNHEHTEKGLNLFDEVSHSSYTFSNACAKYSTWQVEENLFKTEKNIFFATEGMNREGEGYPVARENLKNQLFLINCGWIESQTNLKDEGRIHSYPLELTTKNYEVQVEGTCITITPLQIVVSGKASGLLKEVVICFKDGNKKVAISNGKAVDSILGTQTVGGNEEEKYAHNYFKTPINFENIDSVEGTTTDGKEWRIEIK